MGVTEHVRRCLKSRGLYIELQMQTEMDRLWEFTQDPALHQRWDLRFSAVGYLPKITEDAPQQFLYETRVGLGLSIMGAGESTGTRFGTSGECTSARKFWSVDALSPISTSTGYWKYIPDASKINFVNWYDYQTRFGIAGRLVDTVVLRPVMGWATAWSLDRLRLWLERGYDPELVLRSSVVYSVSRGLIVVVWMWHGIVPKLLFHDIGDLAMLSDAGVAEHWLPLLHVGEIVFGLVGVFTWRWRLYFLLTGAAMLAALVAGAMRSPFQLNAAFNPITPNIAVMGLCLCGWIAHYSAAFAGRCLRKPAAREP